MHDADKALAAKAAVGFPVDDVTRVAHQLEAPDDLIKITGPLAHRGRGTFSILHEGGVLSCHLIDLRHGRCHLIGIALLAL
jgi:hypothetical protein